MSGSVRIMPLGDSITVGFPENKGGYRGTLYQKLVDAGYALDFVGGEHDGPICDPDHEGHSSRTADWIRDNVLGWLTRSRAEIVLLHIGTNSITVLPPDEKVRSTTSQIAQILDQLDSYEASSVRHYRHPRSNHQPRGSARFAGPGNHRAERLHCVDGECTITADRLVVANFEPALSYPADIDINAVPPHRVHPNASGYAKMATVWFDALVPLLRSQSVPVNINRRWQGPLPFGDAHLSPGAPVSVFQQSPGVWTGLTVDKVLVHSHVAGRRIGHDGTMNVVWADLNLNSGWQGPKAFGDVHLVPGAPVSIFQQSPGVWSGLTVDQAGTMNVVWGDFNLNNGWQGPKAFGGAHLAPGAPVSIFQQSPAVCRRD